MDRIYVKHAGRAPVHQLGLDLWRDGVVRHAVIRERTLAVALDAVARERAGEVVDRGLLRSLTSMLAGLGPAVYAADWEAPFLAQSAAHYAAEAAAAVAAVQPPEYLRRAEARLAEEVARVAHYMDAVTEPKIVKTVETALLASHLPALVDAEAGGAVALLEADAHADLKRMYDLLRRVDGGLDALRARMGAHVRDVGRGLVTDPERAKDAVAFVDRLLVEKAGGARGRGGGRGRAARTWGLRPGVAARLAPPPPPTTATTRCWTG